MIIDNSTIKNIQNDLRKITGQNINCELKEFTFNINLQHEPTIIIMQKIIDYVYKNVPAHLYIKIN